MCRLVEAFKFDSRFSLDLAAIYADRKIIREKSAEKGHSCVNAV